MILNKIKGLWMIISAFIPIIWIGIFINMLLDINHLFNSYLNTINSAFAGITSTLNQSADALNDSVEPIREVQVYLSDVSQKISSIPDTIPRFNLSVPGITDVKNLLVNNFNILDKLSEVVNDITSIGQIQGYYQQIVVGIQKAVQELQIIGIKILTLIILGLMIVIPFLIQVFITPYIRWAHRRVKRGWQLINN